MNNVFSLILGLCAWGLGLSSIRRGLKRSVFSMGACCLSLFFQIREVLVQVNEQDWSCLLDTWDTVAACAGVLMVVIITLNLPTLLRPSKKGTP